MDCTCKKEKKMNISKYAFSLAQTCVLQYLSNFYCTVSYKNKCTSVPELVYGLHCLQTASNKHVFKYLGKKGKFTNNEIGIV